MEDMDLYQDLRKQLWELIKELKNPDYSESYKRACRAKIQVLKEQIQTHGNWATRMMTSNIVTMLGIAIGDGNNLIELQVGE